MLEEKIDALTVQMKRVADLLEKQGGDKAPASGGTAAKGAAKGAAKAKGPKYSAEQVKAKILEVKEQHDMDRAKAVISDAGGSDLANLLTQPDKFDEAYRLAEEALAEEGGEGDENDGL